MLGNTATIIGQHKLHWLLNVTVLQPHCGGWRREGNSIIMSILNNQSLVKVINIYKIRYRFLKYVDFR